MTSQPVDPDKPCPHMNFDAQVEVNRLQPAPDQPVNGYSAAIRIRCADCGEPFRFIGIQAGLRGDRPMCSVDETELRAPVRPASSDPDFGLSIPGFAVGMRPTARTVTEDQVEKMAEGLWAVHFHGVRFVGTWAEEADYQQEVWRAKARVGLRAAGFAVTPHGQGDPPTDREG